MTQEGSVAPKERVNITYKPATGDAKEEVELPLKVLVMGGFTSKDDGSPVEDRKPLNIDKDNFSDVMKAQKLSLDFKVSNKLVSDDPEAEMNVSLKFDSLKDFAPDAVSENVPEMKKLIEMREALKALKGPLGNIPDFRKKIQSLVNDPGARDKLMKELGLGEEKAGKTPEEGGE